MGGDFMDKKRSLLYGFLCSWKNRTWDKILVIISLEPQGSVQQFSGFFSGLDLALVKNPGNWWSLPCPRKMVMRILGVGWMSELHNGFPLQQELTSGSHIILLFNLSQIWDMELWIHLVTSTG